MAFKVHFEVLRDSGGGWNMVASSDNQAEAESEARRVMGEGRSRAVRVMRSSFNPSTGTFNDSEVLFLGDRAKASPTAGSRQGANIFPCWKPGDFYDAQGRLGIAKALREALDRWRLTPLELLHNGEHVARLHDTDTVLQAAVQRTAIEQTKGTEKSAQARTRELFDVIKQAADPVYSEGRKKRLPRIVQANYGDFLREISGVKNWRWQFFIGFADHLQPMAEWPAKVDAALALWADPAADERVDEALDGWFSEVAASKTGLPHLIGPSATDAVLIERLTGLILGPGRVDETAPPAFAVLSTRLAAGALPELRRAVAARLRAVVANGRPLGEAGLLEEARVVGRVYKKLLIGPEGGLFGGEPMEEAFAKRCEGFTHAFKIAEMLDAVDDPRDQFGCLVQLADAVVGTANRRRIGDIAMEILENPAHAERFVPRDASPFETMTALARLQAKAATGGFDKRHRERAAHLLDTMQLGLIRAIKLFDRLDAREGDEIDHARYLLDLIDKGLFTRGQAKEAAKTHLSDLLRASHFLERFVGRLPPQEAAQTLLKFRAMLEKHGVRAKGLG